MLTQSKNFNQNYAARVIRLEGLKSHSGADRLQILTIFGNNVITGLTAQEGDVYIYFPAECAINPEFLSFTNSFRDKELNVDKEKTSLFEANCRVKNVKLRGEFSNGYIVPAKEVSDWLKTKGIDVDLQPSDVDFDEIGGIWINKKYVSKTQLQQENRAQNNGKKQIKPQDVIVDGQFQFHGKTDPIGRNMHNIRPETRISISDKIHGSLFSVSNLLKKRKLSILEKIAKFFGVKVVEQEYGMVYASRTVIKTIKSDGGYYTDDIWKIVADRIFVGVDPTISVYGEVYGYTPTGGMIQPKYDYGTKPGQLDYIIYRITSTGPHGDVIEFTPDQIVDYCQRNGLNYLDILYTGPAASLVKEINEETWEQDFLQALSDKYLEKYCPKCINKVWAEGIIVRDLTTSAWRVFKYKSKNFLLGESKAADEGQIDFEEGN